MAIINNILRGQLKGRIGNNWFAHAVDANGRPVTRTGTINANPSNPKTQKQMEQRSRFANAVKFYRHAVQNFFKFAFEDKKRNESDYNAFMRHNIKNALNLYKSQVDNPYFPSLGNKWQLSQGVLAAGLHHEWLSDGDFDLGLSGNTVGEISNYLVSVHGLFAGDIVTIVGVTSMVTSSNYSQLDNIDQAPIWHIWQFFIDPKSNTPIAEIANTGVAIGSLGHRNNTQEVYLEFTNAANSNFAAVVVTRKTSRKLLASTSFLEPNTIAQSLIATLDSEDTADAAVNSWGVGEEAILKGSIADEGSSSVSLGSVNGGDIPVAIADQVPGRVVELKLAGTGLDTLAKSSFVGKGCTISSYTAAKNGKSATLDIVTGSGLKEQQVGYGGTVIANISVPTASGAGGQSGQSTITSVNGNNAPASLSANASNGTCTVNLLGTHLDEVTAKEFTVSPGSIGQYTATSPTAATLIINSPDEGSYTLKFEGATIATINITIGDGA